MYIRKDIRNKIYKAVLEYRKECKSFGICYSTREVLYNQLMSLAIKHNIPSSVMYYNPESFIELRPFINGGYFWFTNEESRIKALKKAIKLSNPN